MDRARARPWVGVVFQPTALACICEPDVLLQQYVRATEHEIRVGDAQR